MFKQLLTVMAFPAAILFASNAGAQGFRIYKVADTSTQIPGAPAGQTFSSFDAPSASRNSLALGPDTAGAGFRATGPDGLIGVYATSDSSYFSPAFAPFRLADTKTSIPAPGAAGTFADFTPPTFNMDFLNAFTVFTGQSTSGFQGVYSTDWTGENLSVYGAGGHTRATAPSAMGHLAAFGQGDASGVMTMVVRDTAQIVGIEDGFFGPPSVSRTGFFPPGNQIRVAYAGRDDSTGPMTQIRVYRPELPEDQVQIVASTANAIPSGTGTFTRFGDPGAGEDGVYFRASGLSDQQGIYEYQFTQTPAMLRLVDRNTPVPGKAGVSFTDLSDPAVYRSDYVFLASLSDGNQALYSDYAVAGFRSGLTELISTGDLIDGKTIDALEISREAVGGGLNPDYAFKAHFTDGFQGIYLLRLPEPGAMMLAGAGIVLGALRNRSGAARPRSAMERSRHAAPDPPLVKNKIELTRKLFGQLAALVIRQRQRLGPALGLRADVVMPLQHRPRPDCQARRGDVALDLGLGSHQHRAARHHVALDLPPHDQPPAQDLVGDDVPLLLDRDHAQGLDRPAGLVLLEADVFELERLVAELARERQGLASDFLRPVAVEADDDLSVVGQRDGKLAGHASIVDCRLPIADREIWARQATARARRESQSAIGVRHRQ
jgi:hypothetical protein